MRILAVILALLLSGRPSDNDIPEFPSINTKFPLLWKTKIGCASFRTNVSFYGGNLVIGSNGDNFYDWNAYDDESGVYVINARTGKVNSHFAGEFLGDMDINGILVYDGKYYFGNDNEEFLCTDSRGNIVWRNLASGDIEHEPSLISIDGEKAIVYASELGEVRAVNPATGKTVWSYFTPDFSGFKETDNRTLFKVRAFFESAQSFFAKPIISDLNDDGVADLIYNTYDDKIYALNGRTGRLLWKFSNGKAFTQIAALSGSSSEPRLLLISTGNSYYLNKKDMAREICSEIITLDRKGSVVSTKELFVSPHEFGLNCSMLPDGSLLVNTDDSIFQISKQGAVQSWYHGIDFNYVYDEGRMSSVESRIFGQSVFGQSAFSFAGNPKCVMLLNQNDYANWGGAFIEILNLQQKTVLERLRLPGMSEMPPLIRDINGDGYLDLLVCCHDGYLYCYNMKIKAGA